LPLAEQSQLKAEATKLADVCRVEVQRAQR
jgi:hypothetical protein